MSIMTATNLAKSFGPIDIFSGVSLAIPLRARIGLVGPNGVGKTTLLRILAEEDTASAGRIDRARNLHFEYLPQEAVLHTEKTLWEECVAAFAHLIEQEADLAELEAAMADPDQREAALERYGPAQLAFEQAGGYTFRLRMKQILTGLGFAEHEYQRPLPKLSGGQRTRALLAKILLSDPDLVILDEPTNHLDIAAVEWLENYLRDWDGAALIVSHDRYFLDRVINVVWEMTPMGFESYRGNYSAYVQTREDRWQRRQDLFKAEIQRMETELDYVRRNIAGQRTTQAQGKLRRLSRQIEAIEKGGFLAVHGKKWGQISDELAIRGGRMMRVDEAGQRLKGLRIPSRIFPDLNLNLKAAQRSGDLVLRTYDLEIGYADAPGPLFSVPDLIFHRGECAAVIGPNGAGKTTFLKTILGQLPPLAGELDLGASLEVGYFAQAHEELDPSLTLVEEIEQVAPRMLLAEIRNYLARFLFKGDEVFKQVAVLSGGERGRLALAKLALSDANLLMLDEPTNHLDIPSQEVLQAVLADFRGTILLVSHDRYLIDALGTQIWEIEPKRTALTVFGGSYTAYRGYKESQSGPVRERSDDRDAERAARRRRANWTGKQAKQRRERLVDVEAEITDLENRLEKLTQMLENPPPEVDRVQKLGARYVEVQNQLDALLAEWEDLADDE